MAETPVAYCAFISYSSEDHRLGLALERGLRRIGLPWYRRSNRVVFRDQTVLGAGPLWPSLEAALDRSGAFLLLASADAADSDWVTRELEHWLSREQAPKPLLAVAKGEVSWKGRDFDWHRTTALPARLRGVYGEEPKWVDLRAFRDARRLSLRDRTFLEKVAELADPILGKSKRELVDEDRRTRRRGYAAAGGLFALLLATAVAATVFQLNARHERAEKHEQQLIRESVDLANASQKRLAGRLDQALLLAVQAERTYDTPQARRALFAALESRPELVAFLPRGKASPGRASDAVFTRDGRRVVVAYDGKIAVWDTRSPRPPADALPATTETRLAIGRDHEVVAAGLNGRVVVRSLDRAVVPRAITGVGGEVGSVATTRDGSLLALGLTGGRIEVRRTRDGALSRRLSCGGAPITTLSFSATGSLAAGGDGVCFFDDDGSPRRAGSGSVHAVALSSDGTRLAWADDDGGVVIQRVLPPHEARQLREANVAALAFRPGAAYQLASAGTDGTITLRDGRGRVLRQFTGAGSADTVAFSPDGRLLVTAGADGARLWRPAAPSRLERAGLRLRDSVLALAFDRGGRTLAAALPNGDVSLLDIVGARRPRIVETGCLKIVSLALGAAVTTGGADGLVTRQPLAGPSRCIPATRAPGSTQRVGLNVSGEAVAVDSEGQVAVWKGGGWDQGAQTQLQPVTSVALAGDARTFAVSAPAGVSVSSLGTKGAPSVVENTENGYVSALALSPDAHLLAAGSLRSWVGLWELDGAARPIAPLLDWEDGPVLAVAISPDGRLLAAGGSDGTIVVWAIGVDDWVNLACAIVNRNLAMSEQPPDARSDWRGCAF